MTRFDRGCLFAILVLASGCDLPGKPKIADRPVPADQVVDFATLYKQNCSGCHGADGNLGPAPPLNDPLFRAIIPEDELESVIARGRKKTLMPAFAKEHGGTLTAAQIRVLVKEIKGLPYGIIEEQVGKVEIVPDAKGISPKWGRPAQPPAGAPPYREPPVNANGNRAGDKEKGATVFARACVACHGKHGHGIEKGNKTVNAINDPVFLALNSDQVLRRYIITGRPDLGMPSYAEGGWMGIWSGQEITDLVALLASWRGEK